MTVPALAKRLIASVVMLVVLSILVFTVLRLIPGSPTAIRAGGDESATAGQLAHIRVSLGLHGSIASQYVRWLKGTLHGNFGVSYFSGYPVTTLIAQRIGATVELVVAAMLLGMVTAIPLATSAVLRPGSIIDRLISTGATIGMSVPPLCVGLALLTVFAVKLGWLPTRGYVSLTSDPGRNLELLILPATTLGIGVAALLLRYLRAALIDELGSGYLRTARSKGLTRSAAVIRHALPNGSLPTLNVLGVLVATLLGGVVVIEYVFGWPGLGSLVLNAVQTRDYPTIQAVVMLSAVVFVVTTLCVDLLGHLIDPRLRVRDAR